MSELARERCITCSDEAVEAEVVSVDGDTAVVRMAGAHSLRDERVAVDLTPDVAPGDVLLCHAGIALERLEHAPPAHEPPAAEPPAHEPPAHELPQVTKSHKPAQVTNSHKVAVRAAPSRGERTSETGAGPGVAR